MEDDTFDPVDPRFAAEKAAEDERRAKYGDGWAKGIFADNKIMPTRLMGYENGGNPFDWGTSIKPPGDRCVCEHVL